MPQTARWYGSNGGLVEDYISDDDEQLGNCFGTRALGAPNRTMIQ